MKPPPGAVTSLVLASETEPGRVVRFDVFASARAAGEAGTEVYRRIAVVTGPHTAPPASAVYAAWEVADASHRPAFEENRKAFFRIRADVIAGFHADWLLQRVDQPERYLILGLYADPSAREQARTHAQIRRFAEANPVDSLGARDLYGLELLHVLD